MTKKILQFLRFLCFTRTSKNLEVKFSLTHFISGVIVCKCNEKNRDLIDQENSLALLLNREEVEIDEHDIC
jgi:hypothetical protein